MATTGVAQDSARATEVETISPASPTGSPVIQGTGTPNPPAGVRRGVSDVARDVVLMIRTKDFRDLNTLRGDLTVAGARAGCRWPDDGLNLEAIDAGAWRKLRSAFGLGEDLAEDAGVQLTSGDGVQLLATDKKNYFQIRVAPDRQMTEVELTYREAGSNPGVQSHTLKMIPGKPTDDPTEHPLRFDNSGIGGHYSLSLPSQWEPETISIRSDDGSPEAKYEWPQNSLVLGRIEQFEGSISDMFDALKDADIMGVPVKGLEQSQNITIVIADFVRDFATVSWEWVSADEIRIRVPYNQEVSSNRVWFLFPLDAASAAQVKQIFNDRLPQGDYDLANALRGSDNPYPIVAEAAPPTLGNAGDPTWLQLPLVLAANGAPLYFERTYKVPDRKAMQERYPDEVRSLYLYEKDMQTRQFPHRILPVRVDPGIQHVLEQTVQGWNQRIR